jgi:putative ABC transport system permease protein
MQQVLADRLGLVVGDSFRLGVKDFTLGALLAFEPDNSSAGFALGPRTIVRTRDLEGSTLLAPGTLFETKYRMLVPPGTDLEAMKRLALAQFRDAGARWRDSRRGAPGIQEFVDRIGSFLVLVGLAGLAVGGVGVSAAVRAYLAAKVTTIATLKSLGASRGLIVGIYLMQILVLTIVSLAIGLSFGVALPLIAGPLIEDRLPVPIEIGLQARPLSEAGIYGALVAFLFALWPIAKTEEVRPAALYRDAFARIRALPRTRYMVLSAVALAVLVGLAAWFSGVPQLALWTAAAIIGALAALILAALAIRAMARKLAQSAALRGRTAMRLALGAIGGPGEEAPSVILSLGLGLSVLATVGQIDSNLRAAIEGDLPEVAPSFFFVDIQTDQLPGFRARLDGDTQVSRVETAPMLRGLITRINGQPARMAAGGHWVVESDRGITYAAEPPPNTTITAGQWWPPNYTGEPQISFSAEEAAEIGLELGDSLTINVLGRDITGRITSFREVDFSNAGMGFVLSMNPAAIAGAPHSHIATVYAEDEAEAAILRDLDDAFPNITAIRVREAIDNVVRVLNGIAAATTYGAGATLLTGFVVLIGAAAAGERARVYEAAVLKTIGAERSRILRSFALRSALLGAAAGLVAIVAGITAGWAVMAYVMETDFAIDWTSALTIVAGGVAVTMLAGLAFAWRPLASRPAQVLRARE